MQKAIAPILLNLFFYLWFFPVIISAQLHDYIPASAFIAPSAYPTIKLTLSPSAGSSAIMTSRESNILGVQQRNPALINSEKETGGQDLIGNLLGALFIAMGITWLYKKSKSSASLKN